MHKYIKYIKKANPPKNKKKHFFIVFIFILCFFIIFSLPPKLQNHFNTQICRIGRIDGIEQLVCVMHLNRR